VHSTGRELLDVALAEGPLVAAFFHEDQLPLVALHRHMRMVGMASLSRDGQLLSDVVQRLGYRVIRGSTSRGTLRVGRAALRALQQEGASLALAVDGPRGPRRKVQEGAVAFAAMAGRPLVFLAVHAAPAWRARSWDRFLVPLPFARVELRYGLLPAPATGRAARKQLTQRLEARMKALAEG